ncbi:MAG: DNA repair protein RadA [Bacteroidales bacterium]|jgi:DNA repair protein RadA/Sms|nr:DNA repair protein RadA [Bacteroidales bacterium]
MAKLKTTFFCQNCGTQSATWVGKCKNCGEWNTYVEEVIQTPSAANKQTHKYHSQAVRIQEIDSTQNLQRIDSGIEEVNRILGGGIVPGSIVLLGGEPGIGKSTLLLQLALSLPTAMTVLYVSGEESELQLKMRADRINKTNKNCFIINETNTQNIFQHIDNIQPQLLIIDSIQTLQTNTIESSAGSISQIRETTSELQRFAKTTSIPVFLIGHITKDGSLAGPKVLEHIVDVVLQFEGDRNYGYRIVRAIKNRFGSVAELAIFEMQQTGLREVSNPSEILISQHNEDVNGIGIAATIEGLRPFLIETQALVTPAVYGNPQRSSTGFDLRRLGMLLAVLEKKCGLKVNTKDVYLNITGGIHVDDPAADLAVVAAIMSSLFDITIDYKTCFAGEVGLSGEIRPVSRVEQRINEAKKLGFSNIFISSNNSKDIAISGINIVRVSKVANLLKKLFQL